MTFFSLRKTTVLIATTLALAACGKGQQQQQQGLPPPEVGVVKAQAQPVPLTRDLVGRLSATRTADVRARVAGVLQKRLYVEGTDVKEGQPLFQIDPAPFKAALDAQLANLASAQATYQNNHIAADRARSVADKGLLSKTDRDNAEAAERTASASVKQAQANVETAKINLGYATVTAPISGRAGQQQVTEGALVGQSEATLLTTVDQIDPIYVNFTQAYGDIDALRAQAAKGSVQLVDSNKAKVELLRGDGSTYGHEGTLDFSDITVDSATGAVSLRGIVPNPDHLLLPGQYINVRLTIGTLQHAWLVSQLAVQRDSNGPYVFVVAANNTVSQKRIKANDLRGDSWIVTDGLTDGDQIAMSGIQSIGMAMAQSKPGQPPTVKPVPYQPKQIPTQSSDANAPANAGNGAPADANKPAPNKPAQGNPPNNGPANDKTAPANQ